MRQALNLHWGTHRYLIETSSDTLHPKVLLSSRFVTFLNSLLSSTKLGVRLIARLSERDGRTVMGRTTDTLLRDCNLTDIMLPNSKPVKKKMKYHAAPDEEH